MIPSPVKMGETVLWLNNREAISPRHLPLKVLLEVSATPLIVWSKENVIALNAQAIEFFSLDSKSIDQSMATKLLFPLYAQIKQKRKGASQEVSDLEVFGQAQLQDKNNEELVVTYKAFAVTDGVPYTVAVLLDEPKVRTERDEIDEVRSRFETIFENSPVAHFVVSQRGIIQEVNKAACSLLGYNRDQLLKRSISAFQPPSGEGSDESKQVLQAILEGEVLQGIEIPLFGASSERVWVNLTSSPIETQGRISEISIMAIDITRRREAELREEAETNRANLYLEVMTHDLSNINQSLVFSLGLIQEKMDLPDDIQSLLQDTNWSLRRSARMIANMRALITLRENPPDKRRVDPHDMLERAIDSVKEDFPRKEVNISHDVDLGLYEIVGYGYVEQIFFNVLHNAVMFDDSESVRIHISSSVIDRGSTVRFEIDDRGRGIPDAIKEDIFKRTGDPKEQSVGRGLGLTVVARIVDDLQGKIWAEDRVQGGHTQGTRIVLELPLFMELENLPCGRDVCITFYKSHHCTFCDPVYALLNEKMEELQIPRYLLRSVNVDRPDADVDKEDLPMLPTIDICGEQLVGLASETQIHTALFKMLMRDCYPGLRRHGSA